MSQPSYKKELNQIVDHLFREEYGKVVAYLTSRFGFHFLESAQDLAQDTLIEAYQSWSFNGIPSNPQSWIFKVAKNKAINFVLRERKKEEVHQKIEFSNTLNSTSDFELKNEIQDSMLNIIFACCHPEITVENQILLILNILCGFSRKEMANALLLREETIKKRLYRAKKMVRGRQLIEREVRRDVKFQEEKVPIVCMAIYLLFNEGYNSTHNEELIRKELCFESIRLCKILIQNFPANARLKALLATMFFHIARFEARIDDNGAIVLLEDQNRDQWNQNFIEEGLHYLFAASTGNQISTYHYEASIAAQHCLAKDFESTNWKLIQRFYRALFQLKPSPIIQLNLAIVSGMLQELESAIAYLEKLKRESKPLQDYYLLYAALGHFYLKNAEYDLALENFQKAKSLTSVQKEIALLDRKIRLI